MKDLKIAVIGTGFASHLRCNAIKKVNDPRISLVGVFSKNPKHAVEFSKEFSISCYSSKNEIWLSNIINTILICTPNKYHKELINTALENGKNVICEYPLVISNYKDAEELVKKAKKKELFIHIGQTMNYDADALFIISNMDKLGRLLMGYKYMSFGNLGSWFDSKKYEGIGKWYIDSNESGSWFVAAHYHGIQIFRNIFGEVYSISAVDSSTKGVRAGTIILKHESGASSTIQWGMPLSGKLFNSTIISGISGSIEVDGLNYLIQSGKFYKTGKLEEKDTFIDDVKTLLAKLEGRVDFEKDNDDMLMSLKISFIAETAAKENKVIEIK